MKGSNRSRVDPSHKGPNSRVVGDLGLVIKSPTTRLFFFQHLVLSDRGNIKRPHWWHIRGEFIGDRPHKGLMIIGIITSSFIECHHYSDVKMSAMASQITSVSSNCSTVCWGADQRKHQSSASLAFVRGILQWPIDSSYNGLVTRKMFPFDDVIMHRESC